MIFPILGVKNIKLHNFFYSIPIVYNGGQTRLQFKKGQILQKFIGLK